MRNPEELFVPSAERVDVPAGLPLVAALTGFADAGAALSQLNDYFIQTLRHRPVVTFDVDELLDYRARRPSIYFDQDHLVDYEPAQLAVSLVHDELEQPFLLLTGFEPDFQWERFTSAVLLLIERFRVATVTWVHSIPMPVPHTRPIGVTVSGNRPDLAESMSVWKPHTQVPATALHLLEYRLQDTERPTAGFVLLIPHYLSDTEYPIAAVSAIECLSAATALIFPTDQLRENGRDFVGKIDEQVEGNQELNRLVRTLEDRYDTYMAGTVLRSPLTDEDGALPTADEIAAELEKFLAFRHRGDNDPGVTL